MNSAVTRWVMQHRDRTDRLTVILRMLSHVVYTCSLTWLVTWACIHHQSRGLKDWRTLCSCTINNVYNQEAYAHNISVNWVSTLLDYLRLKNTHSLFMTTLLCRYSVGCLCVLVFARQSCDPPPITRSPPSPLTAGCLFFCFFLKKILTSPESDQKRNSVSIETESLF